jgi:hypothetical protein
MPNQPPSAIHGWGDNFTKETIVIIWSIALKTAKMLTFYGKVFYFSKTLGTVSIDPSMYIALRKYRKKNILMT